MADRSPYHLALFNIALLKAPLDAPEIKEFVDFLAPVNAHAEQMPGFVWRLTAPNGEPSSFIPSPFEDPLMITNLAVWTSVESLRTFVYDTVHRYFLQSRRKWFERIERRALVLWWIPAGHEPTLEEAVAKLEHLETHGPTPDAFTFQDLFETDGTPVAGVASRDGQPAG
jgi:hypothetical protein